MADLKITYLYAFKKTTMTDRLKTIKNVILIVAALAVVEIAMLVATFRPQGFYMWSTVGVIALLLAYLVRIALGLVKELEKKDNKPE